MIRAHGAVIVKLAPITRINTSFTPQTNTLTTKNWQHRTCFNKPCDIMKMLPDSFSRTSAHENLQLKVPDIKVSPRKECLFDVTMPSILTHYQQTANNQRALLSSSMDNSSKQLINSCSYVYMGNKKREIQDATARSGPTEDNWTF